ncbi:MAG: glycine cleavage system protein GcvH [Flavobacteriales bacterium]|nr:glycine cleavage system protein GcvH [Flavobacteriales bacterium]
MNIPQDLRYTKEHEWVRMEGDIATIGITDYAQGELGDIVFIEVETVGDEMGVDEVFGTIEAVKTVNDLFSPLDGEVTAFNEGLEDGPEAVNNDPYGNGWIIRMKLSNPSDFKGLLTPEEYADVIR